MKNICIILDIKIFIKKDFNRNKNNFKDNNEIKDFEYKSNHNIKGFEIDYYLEKNLKITLFKINSLFLI